jgi:hypothetical protein
LCYPQLPIKKPIATPTQALNTFLPLRLSATPIETTARAAKLINPYKDTALHPRYHKLDVIQEMNLNKEETFAQVYLSPSPYYYEAFEDTLDPQKLSSTDHQTAGLILQQKGDRLILLSINRSTPAARIPQW